MKRSRKILKLVLAINSVQSGANLTHNKIVSSAVPRTNKLKTEYPSEVSNCFHNCCDNYIPFGQTLLNDCQEKCLDYSESKLEQPTNDISEHVDDSPIDFHENNVVVSAPEQNNHEIKHDKKPLRPIILQVNNLLF